MLSRAIVSVPTTLAILRRLEVSISDIYVNEVKMLDSEITSHLLEIIHIN